MDLNSLVGIASTITQGGPHAVIAILCVIIMYLFWQLVDLRKEVQGKDSKIYKLIDDYHTGNITLTEALTSLKLVLYEIKGRI